MRDKIIESLADFNEEITEDLERDLFAEGILDSFDIVQLVMKIEEDFDIVVDVELVSPENFSTAENIITTIEGILNN